jgi:hypothetical protein
MIKILARCGLSAVGILVGLSPASASPTALPDLRETFVATQFRQVTEFAKLPESARSNLLAHFASREPVEQRVYIADPDQPFNVGDALLPGPPLPMRRLKFGGVAPTLSFIYYEHGGLGFHYHLIIYSKSESEPVFAGRFTPGFKDGKVPQEPLTVDVLKQWLKAGKIRDDAIENNDW